MRRWNPVYPALALCLFAACAVFSQPEIVKIVGPQKDGSVLLPTGWKIRPAGEQIETDTFPMASALSPDKKFLAVLHGGYNPPSVVMLDPATLKEISKIELPDG